MNYEGRWVVVSGIRSLTPRGTEIVASKLNEVVRGRPAGIIFGGAIGADTVALKAAATARPGRRRSGDLAIQVRFVVVVPGQVAGQPVSARNAIQQYADEIIELRLDLSRPGSYEMRNSRMITEARLRDAKDNPLLVAFHADDGTTGGTTLTMDLARGWGVEVESVPVPRAQGGVD